jgi:antitoxin component HigA of HigAB toxin-antitoxin module
MEKDIMKAETKIRFSTLPKDYPGLCRKHLPRPIRDAVDLQNVLEVTDAMAGHNLSPDQEDYFDLLCRLIQDYEKDLQQTRTRRDTGVNVLRHLLDEHGMTAADLARLLNVHRSLGAMILRGERQLTLGHVAVLAQHFGLSADLFLPARQ